MELVSFISHVFSKEVLERYNIIKNSLARGQKLVFITTSKDIIDQLVSNDIKYEYLDISHEEIHENCFQINSTNCQKTYVQFINIQKCFNAIYEITISIYIFCICGQLSIMITNQIIFFVFEIIK